MSDYTPTPVTVVRPRPTRRAAITELVIQFISWIADSWLVMLLAPAVGLPAWSFVQALMVVVVANVLTTQGSGVYRLWTRAP